MTAEENGKRQRASFFHATLSGYVCFLIFDAFVPVLEVEEEGEERLEGGEGGSIYLSIIPYLPYYLYVYLLRRPSRYAGIHLLDRGKI